jgi:hypothetical protein
MWCNVELDVPSTILLYAFTRLPRQLLSVLKQLNTHTINLNKIITYSYNKLREKGYDKLANLIMEEPVLHGLIETTGEDQYKFVLTRELTAKMKYQPEIRKILKHLASNLIHRYEDLLSANPYKNRYHQIISRAFKFYGYYTLLTDMDCAPDLIKLQAYGSIFERAVQFNVNTVVFKPFQPRQASMLWHDGVLTKPFKLAFGLSPEPTKLETNYWSRLRT